MNEGHGDPNYHKQDYYAGNNIEPSGDFIELAEQDHEMPHEKDVNYMDDEHNENLFEKDKKYKKQKKDMCQLIIGTLLIIISIIATISTYLPTFPYMLHIVGFFGSDKLEQFYYGLNGRKFVHIDDEGPTSNLYKSGEIAIPCHYGNRSFLVAARLTQYSIVFMILGIIFIIYTLFYRKCTGKNNIVKIFCLKIPQRGTVIGIFKGIGALATNIVIAWSFLGLWAELEFKSYVLQFCTAYPPGNPNDKCATYFLPHYGFAAMLIIPFWMGCCTLFPSRSLGKPFTIDNMSFYYPVNSIVAKDKSCSLNLKRILALISSTKSILIYALCFLCLQESGLISFWVLNTGAFNITDLFNITGTVQSHGTILNTNYKQDKPYGNQWYKIGLVYYYYTYIIILINIILIFIYTIILQKYKTRGIIKYLTCFLSFFQWFFYTLLTLLYIYHFYQYWNNNGKNKISFDPRIEGPINDKTIATPAPTTPALPPFLPVTKIYVLPDWGVIIFILLQFYMIKQFFYTFFSM